MRGHFHVGNHKVTGASGTDTECQHRTAWISRNPAHPNIGINVLHTRKFLIIGSFLNL